MCITTISRYGTKLCARAQRLAAGALPETAHHAGVRPLHGGRRRLGPGGAAPSCGAAAALPFPTDANQPCAQRCVMAFNCIMCRQPWLTAH